MVKIVIENLGQKELLVNDTNKPVLQAILSQGIDWMHACGGKGRCTTCKMVVVQGQDNLTAPSPAELRYQAQQQLHANERLTCQSRLKGNIVIRVHDDYKLPHLRYDG